MATWLVVIDMQDVFADPSSEWYSPGAGDLVEPIRRLAAGRGSRVVLTRFVAPDQPAGAWRAYYRQWAFALKPADDPIYRLVDGLPSGAVIDATTFSKWGPALSALIGPDELVICGVATDCCVLSTALGAADAGVAVRVVADACAGSTSSAHDQALALLAGYGPIITVTTVAEELER
jgi:nicotinamidase-related amidase